ncbi:MAG: amino acid permease, partial [Gemmatimonadota bacterium]
MTQESGELRRELGLFDSVMINAGTVIGSAIFIVPGAIAAGFLSSGPSVLVWVVGGLVSLCGALCVAELSAAMPEAGGQFIYLRRAWSPLVGFLYGWGAFLVINTASVAAIAVGFASYLSVFVPLSAWGIKLAAALSIVALTVLNVFGVKLGAVTQNILTSLKILALLAIPVLGFALTRG